MRAVIYTGGEVDPSLVTFRPSPGDLILAADSGFRTARLFGVVPDILLGDFDSLGSLPPLPPSAELVRVPAEKDDTDTQLAVSVALSRGADFVMIIGGLGGRPDHSFANLAVLEDLARRGIPALLDSGRTRARFLSSGSVALSRETRFRYLSLLPADRTVRGVTLEGVKYPLSSAVLHRRSAGFSISNEITSPLATVSVSSGSLWILETSDG